MSYNFLKERIVQKTTRSNPQLLIALVIIIYCISRAHLITALQIQFQNNNLALPTENHNSITII